MSKVVLDTNIIVAAFAARGLCESTFELCLEKHELITSEFLLEECKEKLIRKIKLPNNTVEEILELYRKNSHIVIPNKVDSELCRDPDDLPVLRTCFSEKADYLISGDNDLLILDNIGITSIITPRRFYDLQR